MDGLKARVARVVEELAGRETEAHALQQQQESLLTEDEFLGLLRLAKIDHPSPAAADVDLKPKLEEQVTREIRHLLEHRRDLDAVPPLHRLRCRAEIDGIPPAPAAASNPPGERFREIFPFADPEQGWLVIRRFPEKRALPRPREDENRVPPEMRPRHGGPALPFAVFQDDLARGRDVEKALASYLGKVRAANGFLPVKVRNAEDQKRLRKLELDQIAAALELEGARHLVVKGRLEELYRLLVEHRDPRPDSGPVNFDDLWPLASLWHAVVSSAAGDESALESTCPRLGRDDVALLDLALSEEERRQALELLPRLPANAFLSFFSPAEILRRRAGQGPLADWLCGVKDVFALGRTTAASAILESFVSQIEAAVVSRLRQAGCLFPGKTNLDEFALGSLSKSSAFKPTPGCPQNRLRVAGGSSGGSAAAVGAGLVRFALGSDTAGSIRVPSSWCGVVGWKPSYGIVPRYGVLPLSMGLDVVGLLTRDVRDCIEIASVIVGADPRDETTRGAPAVDFAAETDRLAGKRWTVGVPIEYFLNVSAGMLPLYQDLIGTRDFAALEKLSKDVPELLPSAPADREPKSLDDLRHLDKLSMLPQYWGHFARLLRRIEERGWSWRLVSLPHTWLSIPTYFALSRAELASCLHRYDGVTFGTRSDAESYLDLQRTTRAESFGFQPKIRILMGIHALRQKQAKEAREVDCDFLELAKKARWAIHDDFVRVFDEVDILLTPTTNVVAPPYGGIADPVTEQRLDELTVPSNLAGTAAISLPSGLLAGADGDELPTSIQVIAARFADASLLAAAREIERMLPIGEGGPA